MPLAAEDETADLAARLVIKRVPTRLIIGLQRRKAGIDILRQRRLVSISSPSGTGMPSGNGIAHPALCDGVSPLGEGADGSALVWPQPTAVTRHIPNKSARVPRPTPGLNRI